MSNYDYAIYAYSSVLVLTIVLVVMNIHSVMRNFVEDQSKIRLYAYLGTLLVVSSLMIVVDNSVIDHVLDAEMIIQTDTLAPPSHFVKKDR